jgi:hypothetical protein
MVPRERVKRERRAPWLDVVRGQVGGCPRNCQRRAVGPSDRFSHGEAGGPLNREVREGRTGGIKP